MRHSGFLALGITLQLSCGYFQGGSWDDDPANWKRAFRSERPQDVQVLHSRYWRSTHWSYEFQYFFEIAGNPAFRKAFFDANPMVRLAESDVADAIRDPFGKAPPWFCPKRPEQYEAWIYRDTPRGNFTLFVDKESGTLFLTDYQV